MRELDVRSNRLVFQVNRLSDVASAANWLPSMASKHAGVSGFKADIGESGHGHLNALWLPRIARQRLRGSGRLLLMYFG